jgi:hypothetical protein
VATGETQSFRDIAERIAAASSRKVSIKTTPRSGPLPHNGYRPFDIAGCRRAFPGFSFTSLPDGLARLASAPAEAR